MGRCRRTSTARVGIDPCQPEEYGCVSHFRDVVVVTMPGRGIQYSADIGSILNALSCKAYLTAGLMDTATKNRLFRRAVIFSGVLSARGKIMAIGGIRGYMEYLCRHRHYIYLFKVLAGNGDAALMVVVGSRGSPFTPSLEISVLFWVFFFSVKCVEHVEEF